MAAGTEVNRSALAVRVRKSTILSNEEIAEVRRLRGLRMSWDAVARALGRTTPDVRATCDPDWRKGAGA